MKKKMCFTASLLDFLSRTQLQALVQFLPPHLTPLLRQGLMLNRCVLVLPVHGLRFNVYLPYMAGKVCIYYVSSVFLFRNNVQLWKRHPS